jgi:hypothetical protein
MKELKKVIETRINKFYRGTDTDRGLIDGLNHIYDIMDNKDNKIALNEKEYLEKPLKWMLIFLCFETLRYYSMPNNILSRNKSEEYCKGFIKGGKKAIKILGLKEKQK